jgi:hypothetical protein
MERGEAFAFLYASLYGYYITITAVLKWLVEKLFDARL